MGFATCALCFSLRTGNLLIAAVVFMSGTVEALIGAPLLGLLDVCVGGIGVWAVWHKDKMWLKRYFWFLAAAIGLHVVVSVFTAEMNRAALRNQLESLEGQDGPIKWDNSSLHDAYVLGLVSNIAVWLFIGAWFLLTLHSYLQVLSMGFTGEEKLAPESLVCMMKMQGKEVTETSVLLA